VSESDKDKFLYAGVGAALMLAVCLLIGVLDEYNLLDKLLDFLHFPK